MRFLPLLLRRAIRKGRLTVIGPAGEVEIFGGTEPGPAATIRIGDPTYDWKIAFNPELKAAEAYMEGALTSRKATSTPFWRCSSPTSEASI